MRNFNHVILPRLPTSEIILLIFRRDIIIVHYRPRYAVKRDLSGVRGHRQDKHVSECLKIARQLPHNTHSCPLKFNCEFDSIFARQVSAVPGRLWKSGARARALGKLFAEMSFAAATVRPSGGVPNPHGVIPRLTVRVRGSLSSLSRRLLLQDYSTDLPGSCNDGAAPPCPSARNLPWRL